MDYDAILEYFDDSAKTGQWDSLYNPQNPSSYSFIVRLQKAIDFGRPFKDKKVLDLGCGTGVLTPFVIKEGGQYIGLDASEKMLERARKIYPEYVNEQKVSYILGDIRSSSLPDDLGIIVGLGFIEYFDNPEALTSRLYNKLHKSGRLILSFPNFHSLDYLFVKSLAPFRYLARKIFRKSTHQPPRRLWNIKEAKRLYINTGFKNLKVVNYNVNILGYPITKISKSFTNLLAKRFEYSPLSKCSLFATGFIVSGEK